MYGIRTSCRGTIVVPENTHMLKLFQIQLLLSPPPSALHTTRAYAPTESTPDYHLQRSNSLSSTTAMSCPDCFRGVAFDTEPQGVLSDIEGAYLATAKGDTPSATRAVIVLTDIFGLQLPNAKVLADLYAEQLGCDVWVPDLFGGEWFASYLCQCDRRRRR